MKLFADGGLEMLLLHMIVLSKVEEEIYVDVVKTLQAFRHSSGSTTYPNLKSVRACLRQLSKPSCNKF